MKKKKAGRRKRKPFLYGRALTEPIHKRGPQDPAPPHCSECGTLLGQGEDVTCEVCEGKIEGAERAEIQANDYD
jgi:hypothetical protein